MTDRDTLEAATSFGFDLDRVPDETIGTDPLTGEKVSARSRLAALIPSPAIEGAYLSRTLEGGHRDLDAFAAHLEMRENVLLVGPTAAAKTTAARAFAARHGLPFTALALNGGVDPSRFWGQNRVTDQKLIEYVLANLTLILKYGGVTLVDEPNMAHPAILAALHELLDVRRSVTIPELHGATIVGAHPLLIIGACNPAHEYAGAQALNYAFQRRFVTIQWDYDRDIEAQLLDSETLLDAAWNMRTLGVGGSGTEGRTMLRTPVSTDALIRLERHAHRLGIEYAVARFVDAFADHERSGVARALEMVADSIAEDLGV